jgi:hypothetical protein
VGIGKQQNSETAIYVGIGGVNANRYDMGGERFCLSFLQINNLPSKGK